MRSTWSELDPLRRGVVHALELSGEDATRWATSLNDAQMFARPFDLPPVAFHLRHMARSLDRLLSYAEGLDLSTQQLDALSSERVAGTAQEVRQEFERGLKKAIQRVIAVDSRMFEAARGIGRKRLPTTVGGLLVHCAEHTQRHSGQMVTTAKLVSALSASELPRPLV